jgi:hypothetical protein
MAGMPMAGGAGAGGGKDRDHQTPDYLRGRYLHGSEDVEYDRNGNVIVPYGVDAIEWLRNHRSEGQ